MSRVAGRGLLVLALLVALGPASPGVATPLAHREVLPNGIVLLVAERPAVPIVAVRVFATEAGAAFDPPGREGLAGLTASLLTRGTARRTGPELDAAIEFVGGALETGASRDGLSVSLSVLRKDLALGLDLLGEVLLAPTFPEGEVARKRTEIQAAIQRSEESPDGVAARALARLVFPGHPYGRPAEGTRESVGRLGRDDVVAFHRARLRPDATIVAVVGAVTVAEARREVLARLGGWPRPAAAPGRLEGLPAGTPAASETVRRQLTQATILLGRQAVTQRDPDYFPLAVASYILGGGSASRLYTRVREEAGLAYSVYASLAPGRLGAALTVGAQTRTAEVDRVVALIAAELERLGREPVPDAELGAAKAYLIGSFPLRLDTTSKVADFLVGVEQLGLGLDYADRYRDRVGRVTPADVQRVAAIYLAPAGLSRVTVGNLP